MKDHWVEHFNKTAQNYGLAVSHLGMALESMKAGKENINLISGVIDIDEYLSFLNGIDKVGEEMYDKCKRIYSENVPDVTQLEKITPAFKAVPVEIPDKLNDNVPGQEVLTELIPLAAKPFIGNYKQRILDYIKPLLGSLENDGTIMKFLDKENLPKGLDEGINQYKCSDALWYKIDDIQERERQLGLLARINTLDQSAIDIDMNISNMEKKLKTEDNDDQKFRSFFKEKWYRKESKYENYIFTQKINDYRFKLQKSIKINNETKETVMKSIPKLKM